MKKMGNWRFFTFKRQFVVKLEKLDNAKYTLKLSVYAMINIGDFFLMPHTTYPYLGFAQDFFGQ